MKFNFSVTGGIAGLTRTLNDDADALPPSYAKLFTLITKVDSNAIKPRNPLARDMFVYKLSFDTDGKHTQLVFSDDNIPSQFEPLISYLRQKAV
ncbi:protealysin inhibitor emfourin [Mucilaginibacter sp. FT3.2]|uniref:protealysin inhibitor emfourin n=1 Tax=Mucilaginibacter sp. FT3.2 TaxID=2723090 RepID=UPI0016098005|nr:protealysin inhibitor emfourin [Mucilaginibacter sp. FT3.2]MBB6229939.1 hypothetical protein [Mucilaginibacter sp. FT3.2]